MNLSELIERCRRQQQQKPGQLEIPEVSGMLDERLMAVYEAQTNFMLVLKASAEGTWASADEALAEWRSRTLPDWGFAPSWIY